MKVANGERRVQFVALSSLEAVLPKIGAQRRTNVSNQIMPTVFRTLQTGHEARILSALHVMEMLGTGSAPAQVGRLSRRHGNLRIRYETKRILPVLLERKRLKDAQRRLLRPAHDPDAPEQTLLRTIQGTISAHDDTLLRPVVEEVKERP